MTIQVWNSFSCNNSSSARLVARFVDAATARDVEHELRTFLGEHAEQLDQALAENDYTFPDTNPASAQALARKYGFAWGDVLAWGDDQLVGDEPQVASTDEVLVVYHSYCNGFGTGIPAYLAARGGAVETETRRAPHLSLLFAYAGGKRALDEHLAMLFAQIGGGPREVDDFVTPWSDRKAYGDASCFRDAQSVGIYAPIPPGDIAELKTWLAGHGLDRASLRYCEDGDEKTFATIGRARCLACSGALVYWDPRIHDIHAPQLACTTCGGMYDLTAFVSV